MAEIIDGLAEFRKEFRNKIWLEVFVLPGYNYSDNEIDEIAKAIRKINPDSVQLNTLDRPGTEDNLIPATRDQLEHIIETLGLDNVEIIASAHKKHKKEAFRSDTEDAILGTISRRPCTVEDLSEILGMPIVEISKYLSLLEAQNKIEWVEQARGVFYQVK